ncbi:hypothetical protein CMT84_18025 [Elizabethkingia anophelis]|nr:hypothetical protein [Elizabethkingia anophelis]
MLDLILISSKDYCFSNEVFINVYFNPRNGKISARKFFDNTLCKGRFVIERTNRSIDTFIVLLKRLNLKVVTTKNCVNRK